MEEKAEEEVDEVAEVGEVEEVEEEEDIEQQGDIQYPSTICSLRPTSHTSRFSRHYCICQPCINKYQLKYNMNICPICRTPLESWLITYLPH